MRKFLSVFLSLVPGTGHVVAGEFGRGFAVFFVFYLLGWAFRASGVLGPQAFLIFFVVLWAAFVFFVLWGMWVVVRLKSSLNFVRGVFFFFFGIFVLVVGKTYFSPGNVFVIPSRVLEPLVHEGEKIYFSAFTRNLSIGDVVVFIQGDEGRVFHVGVICGLPGEEMKMEPGKVWRDGKLTDCGHADFQRATETSISSYRIPQDRYFILKSGGFDSGTRNEAFFSDQIKGKMLFRLSDVPEIKQIEPFLDLLPQN